VISDKKEERSFLITYHSSLITVLESCERRRVVRAGVGWGGGGRVRVLVFRVVVVVFALEAVGLEFLAGLEADGLAGGDGDLLAGARVAASPRRTVSSREATTYAA
jgi:hypothetical protein